MPPRLYPPDLMCRNKKLLRVMGVDWVANGSGFKELADYRGPLEEGALHFAAKSGLTDACKYLVEGLKLDVNAEDTFGTTPLISAASEGHTATAKYLVEHGAAIQRVTDSTALHIAAGNGDLELLKFLLDKGVSVDLRTAIRRTPLSWAAENRQKDVIKFLLERGAHPDGGPEDCTTPLQAAIAADSFECSKLLIEAGADPNFVAHASNPLHIAANGGIAEIINLLLEARANPEAMVYVPFTDRLVGYRRPRKPIEVAAARGHKEAVEILFPVTKPIPSIKEWSVDGILGQMQPEGGRKKGRKRGQPKSLV